MVHSVIIVGGGFSGLVIMNKFIESGVDFLLFEKNDRLGKKILATGNGRGNISNKDLSLNHYHGSNPSFCEYAIKTYDNRHIARFFEKMGIILTEENGRLYPLSKQANAILDGLRLSDNGSVRFAKVTDVEYNDGIFTAVADGKEYFAKNVIMCVGGKSSPNFGTDGTAYNLVKKFGHKITPLYPSLVQLTAPKESIKGLKGIKENAKVTAYSNGVKLAEVEGDLLFTDNGISGNTVFYLSAYLVNAKNPFVTVDYLYNVNEEVCKKSLASRRNAYPDLTAESFLSGLVHSRISYKTVSDLFGTDFLKVKYKEIDDDKIDKLIGLLKNTEIKITGNTGFANSQVTKGGIDVNQVNNTTMESKLQKGLYFCGEVLDVDGDCGGYNLQWAYSSAMCAYKSVIDRFLKNKD